MPWIDKAISLASQSPSILSRLKAMYESLPHIAEAYAPQAMVDALKWSKPNQISAMTPDEFLSLAARLDPNQAAPYVSHYKDLLAQRKWVEPPPNLFMEHALESRRTTPFEGFDSVPWLQYMQDPSSSFRGQIMGHEGRHRNITLKDAFGPDLKWPVRFSSSGDELPKRPYFVYPEWASVTTEPMDLSPLQRFAQGGLA